MNCLKPYVIGSVPFGCGQCVPCRINKQREWTARQVLESFCHEETSFVTLTYSEGMVPEDGGLRTEHARNWLKRLRKRIAPRKVRYFLCGEYGEESRRPHYHATMFGLGLRDARVVEQSWGKGHTLVAEFNVATARYVCGYVVKRRTHRNDKWLEGLPPEFARMSNRPGLGAQAMEVFADAVMSEAGLDELDAVGDVPHAFRMTGKLWPLGRYLRRKLREEVGVSEDEKERIIGEFIMEKSLEVSALLQDAISRGDKTATTSSVCAEQNKGRAQSVVARHKIMEQKGKL